MVTLKQLIEITEFDKVWDVILKHYVIGLNYLKYSKDSYAIFYKSLIALSADVNKDNMVIYIKILKEDSNDDYYFPENYDENDRDLFFDVCGKDNNWDCYALEGSRFEEWLGYYIDEDTLSKLTIPSIIGHCIMEMSYFGLDQK